MRRPGSGWAGAPSELPAASVVHDAVDGRDVARRRWRTPHGSEQPRLKQVLRLREQLGAQAAAQVDEAHVAGVDVEHACPAGRRCARCPSGRSLLTPSWFRSRFERMLKGRPLLAWTMKPELVVVERAPPRSRPPRPAAARSGAEARRCGSG